jgi:hypothetical protein
MGVQVTWLGGYIYPFFTATGTPDVANDVPASVAAIATLIEWAAVAAVYSRWLQRTPVGQRTFASALAAVVIMAVINFLFMGALGLSVHTVRIRM